MQKRIDRAIRYLKNGGDVTICVLLLASSSRLANGLGRPRAFVPGFAPQGGLPRRRACNGGGGRHRYRPGDRRRAVECFARPLRDTAADRPATATNGGRHNGPRCWNCLRPFPARNPRRTGPKARGNREECPARDADVVFGVAGEEACSNKKHAPAHRPELRRPCG